VLPGHSERIHYPLRQSYEVIYVFFGDLHLILAASARKDPLASYRRFRFSWELAFFKNNTNLRMSQEAHSKRRSGLWIFTSLKKLWKRQEDSELFSKRNCLRLFPDGMNRPLFPDLSFP
jgi:hypothetical protein